MAQIFPTDFEEKLTMAQDDYILFSDSEDGNKIKKAQYQNLKGEKGDTGARINSASFSGNDIIFGETDGNSVTLANAKTTLTGPKGEDGKDGADGQDGAAATITVGTTTTGDAGTNASVTNSGTSSAAIFNFTIPKGDKGDTGATGSAATISVGSTTTGGAGTSASVVNSGTSSAAVLDFTIPKGDKGDTGNTGATGNGIASITSSKSGKITTVTITETNGNSDSFTVSDGADGQGSGDVIGPASSIDGNVVLFNGATGKLIKDSGKTLPSIVDDLTSSSTTDGLSANQGSILKGMIDDLNGLGKFLSLRDSSTGLPISFPLSTPYTYTTGDYFLVETVSSATPPVNYKPTGSSYTGTASSTTESDELEAGDVYIYDGTTWLLQSNHGKTVAFSNIAGNPEDNTALDNALDAKQDSLTLPATPTQGNLVTWGADNKTLVDGGAIPTTPSKATSSALGTIKLGSDTVQSTSAEAVSGTANRTYAIQLNSSDQAVVNVPWENTTYSNLAAASGGADVSLVTTGDKYNWDNKQSALVSGTNIKTVNGNSLLGSGNLTISGGITKVFTLASTSDLTTAQAAYDWWVNGGNPIVNKGGDLYKLSYAVSSQLMFSNVKVYGSNSTTGALSYNFGLEFIASSGSVTNINSYATYFNKSSSAPSSGTSNNTVTFVI